MSCQTPDAVRTLAHVNKRAADFLATSDIDGLLAFHRSQFGAIRMDADSDAAAAAKAAADKAAADAKAAADKAAADKAAADAKQFSQTELNAIIAREKESAKSTAIQELATELGVTVEEAKTLIKAAQDADSAKLSEAEKREKAAVDAEAKAKDRETAAAVKERDASIRASLAQAGVSKDDMADAKRLVDLPDGDVDEKKVDEAVEELKKRRPELFGAKTNDSGGGYTPPGAPTAPKQATRMSDLRAQFREQREKTGAKTS